MMCIEHVHRTAHNVHRKVTFTKREHRPVMDEDREEGTVRGVCALTKTQKENGM